MTTPQPGSVRPSHLVHDELGTPAELAADCREIGRDPRFELRMERAAKAVETPEKVTVRIDEKSDPGRACIAIAKEITLTVTLQSPLGDRAVVDAASGQAVPRR